VAFATVLSALDSETVMTYFDDLSDYGYHSHFDRAETKNVGWLACGHKFEKEVPSLALLDSLWEFCTISVAQMRGIHECDLCAPPEWIIAERNGHRLSLGSAEIRVFSSPRGVIYAAPNLIYHYVCAHHYKPPDEFVQALMAGPSPPSPAYFEKLRTLNLEWTNTFGGPTDGKRRFHLRSP